MPSEPPSLSNEDPSASSEKQAGWIVSGAIPAIAVLIQFQATFAVGDTNLRLNAADIALMLFAPFLIVMALRHRHAILAALGTPLIIAILLATLALTGSLWKGYSVVGDVTNWAALKYVGWYVLLAYLGVGLLLGLVASAESCRRFVACFLSVQAVIAIAFIVAISFSYLNTPINFGPRLTGFVGNPNAMGFYLICGSALAFVYLNNADLRLRSGMLLLAAAAIVVAGVLNTRSVAALIALATLFAFALAMRLLSLRTAGLVCICAAAFWIAPLLPENFDAGTRESTKVIELSVFGKIRMLTAEGNHIEQITLADRLDSYGIALGSWLAHPVFGEGLGTHLHEQLQRLGPEASLIQIHNTLLWLLAETGLVGTALMLTIFAVIFSKAWRAASNAKRDRVATEPFIQGVLLVMVSWAAMSLFHELMYQRVLWLLGGMALGLGAGLSRSGTADGKPDILYVIGSLRVGGSEMHLARVTPCLVERGYTVGVYNFAGLGPLGVGMADQGVRVIDPPFRYPASAMVPARLLVLGLSAVKLFAILLFRRPAIVHFFLPQTYIIGGILARLAGLDRLVMSRRSLNRYQQHHPFLARIERRLHRHMSVILANSKRVLAELRDEEAVLPEKSGLIYNGIDSRRFDKPFDKAAKRRELGIPDGAHVITIVANLIAYKGHRDLLEAVSQHRKALPENMRLLLVGRDDGIESELKSIASDLGLADDVVFLGRRSDVAEILRLSHVGVLCSHEEGFSNAILEGMAAGLPMVVTDVGGNAEAVADGETGIVVPAHDSEALGSALVSLFDAPSQAEKMGQAGRRRVEQLFSLDVCVSKYEELYDGLWTGQSALAPKVTLKQDRSVA